MTTAYYSAITSEFPLLYGRDSGVEVTVTQSGYYVVTWDGYDADEDGVFACVYDQVGNLVIDTFLVNTDQQGAQFEPAITALSGGGFVITWEHDYSIQGDSGDTFFRQVHARIFDADNQPVGGAFIVAAEELRTNWSATVAALDNGNFVIAWESVESSTYEVKAQIFSSGGQTVGGIIATHGESDYAQERPRVEALENGKFAISWIDYSAYSEATGPGERVRIFNSQGVGGASFLVDPAATDANQIGLGQYVVLSEKAGADGSTDVFAQIYSGDGSAGSQFLVNTQTAGVQSSAKVGMMLDGTFIIAWADYGHPDGPVIKTQGYDPFGAKVGGEMLVAWGSSVIAVQGDPFGGFTVTFNGDAIRSDGSSGPAVEMLRFGPVVFVPQESLFSSGDDLVDFTALSEDQTGLIERLRDQARLGELYRAYTGDDAVYLPDVSGYQLAENVRWNPDILFDASDGDDFVYAGNGDDKIAGGSGDDYIVSVFGGDNVIDGGLGFDDVDIDGSADAASVITVNATGDLFTVTAPDLPTSTTRISNVEQAFAIAETVDLSAAVESDAIFYLYDLTAAQTLTGSRNGDIFYMGPRLSGSDALTGSGGNDNYYFRYAVSAAKNEIIRDFDGTDVIDLRPLGSQPTLAWLGLADFSGAAWQARYEKVAGQTIVQIDRDGDRIADRTITLANGEFDLSSTSGAPYLYLSTGQTEQFGGAGGDTLHGLGGGDAIRAFGGDDLILLSGGVDYVDGGAGIDVLVGDLKPAGLFVPPTASQTYRVTGNGIVSSGGTFSTWFTGIEHLHLSTIGGGNFGDTFDVRGFGGTLSMTLGAGNDTVLGTAQADKIDGGNGNDRLDGGAGIDELIGGRGDDTYVIDDPADIVIERRAGGIDTIEVAFDYRLRGNIENLTFTGDADLRGTGNGYDNVILGNDGANVLIGGGGNDTLGGGDGNDALNGGGGADRMTGGAGDDIYSVNEAGDVVVEAAGGGYDTIIAVIDYVLPEAFEKLVLSGRARSGTGNDGANVIVGAGGADTLRGMGGDDALVGGLGSDTLDGGDGADTLTGGGGRDVLTGGAGADRFVFAAGDTGAERTLADRITDFSRSDGDRIGVRGIDANVAMAGDQNFTFIGKTAFTGTAGELRYERLGGETIVMGDIDGDSLADFQIRCTGNIAFAARDFIL